MKYLMLIYGNQEKWNSMPAESWPEAIAKHEAFNARYQNTGELLGAYGLADAVNARLVRRSGGLGGLTTAQIAAPFLVPEATMAQRISRAKKTIRDSGIQLALPPPGPERAQRLRAVLHVLYLIFNEGYAAANGPDLTRPELTGEAIRLARWLLRRWPGDPEVAGLAALMLLTEARRPARTRPDGSLVPLEDQDRGTWDRTMIAEGTALLTGALARGEPGPYQAQAAIAAVHDEAPRMPDTNWPQILALYELLDWLAPGPAVTLNRAVAAAMVHGPPAGAQPAGGARGRSRMRSHHRLLATRARLLSMGGDQAGAAAGYREAARRPCSAPERRHLASMTGRLAGRLDEKG